MRKIIIAIDGFSACGKSTTAWGVAQNLGYLYLDSGAMYRAITYYFIQNYITLTDKKSVKEALQNINISFHFNPKTETNETFLNGLNVEEAIRKMEVSDKVSQVSALKEVREAMVAQQKKLGKSKGVVMDGRDIGTKVFPDAELKIFMNAELCIRAERRQKELLEKDNLMNLEEVKENLKYRDHIDTTRKESPLVQAEDAYEIDTTFMTLDEQIDKVLELANSKIINAFAE